MKKVLMLLLLVLVLSIQHSAQESGIKPDKVKPKIGLLQFSIHTFGEEKAKIKASMEAIQTGIIDKLNESFDIAEVLLDEKEEITYADIDNPEVTIEPVVEPETNKKLKALCEKKGWDGIVFGHFNQEGKLIVVSRFYLSTKYPSKSQKDRIISGKEVEIPVTNLTGEPLKTQTIKSVEILIAEINKKKIPGFFSPQPTNLMGKGTQGTTNSRTNPTNPIESYIAQVSHPVEENVDDKIEPLTAADVFNMIINYGLYCEINDSDDGFQGEGLRLMRRKGITIPANKKFKETTPFSLSRAKGIIIATHRKNKNDDISLSWLPILKENYTYQDILTQIKETNQEFSGDGKNWRLPTILEIFSIVREGTPNHLPPEFIYEKFKNKTLTFWTSTPLKKEGTSLEHQKNDKAYFVVHSIFNKQNKKYSLTFNYQNIAESKSEGALILFVSSPKIYSPQPIRAGDDNIAGLDTPVTPVKKSEDTIPGLDDLPNSQGSRVQAMKNDLISQLNENSRDSIKSIKIAIIPLMNGVTEPNVQNTLEKINTDIESSLKELNEILKNRYQSNCTLSRNKINVKDINSTTQFSDLYQNLRNDKESSSLIQKIISEFNAEIIVTVKYQSRNTEDHNGLPVTREQLTPIIIDGFFNRTINLPLIEQYDRPLNYKNIATEISKTIKKILIEKLELKKKDVVGIDRGET